MKKSCRTRIRLWFLLVVCLAGCGWFAPSVQAALQYKLNKTKVNIVIGYNYQLEIQEVPSGQTKKGAVWSSGNKKVAAVDSSSGLVTARKVGTTTIRVKSKNGRVSAKSRIRVVSDKYKLNVTSKTLVIGETYTLKAKRAAGQGAVASWTSSDTDVAEVDASSGKVTARKEGTATITAKSAAGKITGTAKITVVSNAYTLSGTSASLTVGDTYKFKITKAPKGVKKSVTWSSDNTDVAVVNSKTGVITAKSRGSAAIIVKSKTNQNLVTASAVVYVYDWVKSSQKPVGNYRKYQISSSARKLRVVVNGEEHIVKTSALKKNMNTLYTAFSQGVSQKITYSVTGKKKSTLQVNAKTGKVILTTADGQKKRISYTAVPNEKDKTVQVILRGDSGARYTLLMDEPTETAADFRLFLGENTKGLVSEVQYTGTSWILYSMNTPYIRLDSVEYWSR